jgi:hypothetical protein
MSCSCCVSCRLDRFEASIQEVLSAVQHARNAATGHSQLIIERLRTVANNLDQLRDDLRTNTDAVSARIDKILAEIQATGDNTASAETLADLQTISAHLKAMGTDPTNPVPDLPPSLTV